jgi:hypothetical protein
MRFRIYPSYTQTTDDTITCPRIAHVCITPPSSGGRPRVRERDRAGSSPPSDDEGEVILGRRLQPRVCARERQGLRGLGGEALK